MTTIQNLGTNYVIENGKVKEKETETDQKTNNTENNSNTGTLTKEYSEEELAKMANYYDNSIGNLSSMLNTTKTAAENAGLNTGKTTYTMEEARQLIANNINQNTNMEEIKKKIAEIDKVIEGLNKELNEAQKAYDNAEKNYNMQSDKYAELQQQYNSNAGKYQNITSSIEDATRQLSDEMKEKQEDAIYSAMAEYDETKDGDYETYISNAISGIGMDDLSSASLVKSLKNQALNVQIELGTIKTEMSSAKRKMSSYKTEMDTASININNIKNKITAQEELKASIATSQITSENIGDIALASISPEEKELVTKNNIDLTEKFENGEPKYILAMGRSDNLYHIYEVNGPESNGATSLARKYAPGQGFDIVASGNGYIHDMSGSDDANITNTVINLTSVDASLTSCASETSQKNYTTCSPLSLDMNGDGVKTSDKMIQYDIDGDGELDNINDAADAVLVFDADGDGNSGTSGLECFGNNTDLDGDGKPDGFKDGFQALKAFAQREGLISENDSVLNEKDIKYLEENYGFKVKMGGYNDEAVSLLDVGVTQIDLAKGETTNLMKNFDGQHNDIMTQEGATFTVNGEKRDYADIWHAKK